MFAYDQLFQWSWYHISEHMLQPESDWGLISPSLFSSIRLLVLSENLSHPIVPWIGVGKRVQFQTFPARSHPPPHVLGDQGCLTPSRRRHLRHHVPTISCSSDLPRPLCRWVARCQWHLVRSPQPCSRLSYSSSPCLNFLRRHGKSFSGETEYRTGRNQHAASSGSAVPMLSELHLQSMDTVTTLSVPGRNSHAA